MVRQEYTQNASSCVRNIWKSRISYNGHRANHPFPLDPSKLFNQGTQNSHNTKKSNTLNFDEVISIDLVYEKLFRIYENYCFMRMMYFFTLVSPNVFYAKYLTGINNSACCKP